MGLGNMEKKLEKILITILTFGKSCEKTNKWKLLNKDFAQYKTFTHVYDQILDKTKKKRYHVGIIVICSTAGIIIY